VPDWSESEYLNGRRWREAKQKTNVGRYEKPWLEGPKDKKMKWEKWIFWGFIFVGFLGGAAVCYFAYASVSNLDVSIPFSRPYNALER
jgi:hypothetical protein